MTHSIREVLATTPDGKRGVPLSDSELGEYLSKYYGEADRPRRERHRLRDELYRDGGCQYMKSVIDVQFKNDVVRELRKDWVPHARFSNTLKRIVGETSTVYAEPATREVGGGESNEARYAALLEDLMFDQVMDYANRMLNLHRVVLVGPRVRRDLDGTGTLAIDVVTPANVIAVTHPSDTTLVVAWIFRQEFRSARTEWAREPHWQLWSDHEVMYLDKSFVPIGAATLHGLGLNPWVAITYHAEAIAGFWPGEDGEDLPAAQVAIWMAHILMLKETKSATKQLHVSGDTGMAARGVPIDTDVQREFPEGVSSQVVDMSMDTSLFTGASDHVLGSVGPNYGLSMESLKNGGVQSAEAREAMKEPLRHIRRKQIVPFRRAEKRVVTVLARVLEVDAPDLAFKVVAFKANFGEPQVLQSEMDRLIVFEKKRAAGLDNSVDFYRRENPDVDETGAIAAIARNISIETKRNELMRPLQAISGSLGAEVPDGGTDNENTPKAPLPKMRVIKGGKVDLSWVREVVNA